MATTAGLGSAASIFGHPATAYTPPNVTTPGRIAGPLGGILGSPGNYQGVPVAGVAVGVLGGGGAQQAQPDAANQNAEAVLRNFLHSLGLDALYDRALGWIAGGFNADYVLYQLRQTPEYAARFPGMALRQKAGKSAISEGDYIAYETTIRQLEHQANLLPGMVDEPNLVANWIAGDVSPAEASKRIVDLYVRASQAPPEVQAYYRDAFGPYGDAALASEFLDAAKPLPALQRHLDTATIGGAGRRAGIDLATERADYLAGLGVTQDQAAAGFAQIGNLGVFDATVSERPDLTAAGEGVSAYLVQDPRAQRRIAQRLQARQAAFEGGGGASQTGAGAIGLGVAPQPR